MSETNERPRDLVAVEAAQACRLRGELKEAHRLLKRERHARRAAVKLLEVYGDGWHEACRDRDALRLVVREAIVGQDDAERREVLLTDDLLRLQRDLCQARQERDNAREEAQRLRLEADKLRRELEGHLEIVPEDDLSQTPNIADG